MGRFEFRAGAKSGADCDFDWMRGGGHAKRIPAGRYDLTAAGAAKDGAHCMVSAAFGGTATGADRAMQELAQGYGYVKWLEGGRVAHPTKIWNDRFGK